MRIFEGQELSVERLKSQFVWSLSFGYLWIGGRPPTLYDFIDLYS